MFIKWLIGDMGTAGDYSYQAMHLWTVVIVAAVTAVLLIWQRFLCRQPDKKRLLVVAVSIFQIVFEIGWRIIYIIFKDAGFVALWPAYPCNLGGVLIPVIALTNWKTGKKMFYLFAFVGAMLTFAMPNGIFSTSVFVFPILKSVLQHTGILLIPLLEYVSGSYRSTLKDLGWVITGCLVHLVNCEGIVRLMGLTEDYMFFRSGMPFVIPGVPQFITLSVFAILVLTILSFVADVKGSLAYLRTFRKK